MKREDLSPEFLRNLLAYDPDTGGLTWLPRDAEMVASGKPSEAIRWNSRYAGRPAFTALMNGGYLCGAVYKISLQAHVAAWVIHTGQWPDGEIDHINGDRRDNRISNLRCVSPAENKRNRALSASSTSGVMGVSYNARDSRWAAYIGAEGKLINLGTFRRKDDAIAARQAAVAEYGFHKNHGRNAH